MLTKTDAPINASISPAEWEVMRILWAESPLSSREIINRLTAIQNWKEGTIKSLLNRLIQKGHIDKEANSSPFALYPTISQEAANARKISDLLGPICAKDRPGVLKQLIMDTELSQSDIRELFDLLEDKARIAPNEIACQCQVGQCQCHLKHS